MYEGVIDFEVSVPTCPKWDAFRQDVIDEFQKPDFDDWPHVGPTASIEEISSYAGKINLRTQYPTQLKVCHFSSKKDKANKAWDYRSALAHSAPGSV